VVTQMLRKLGVVGKLVEFFGPGVAALPVADRATIANMAPEYGATCGIFPIDEETLRYLRFSGRAPDQIALVEAYAREQGMFQDATTKEAVYTDVVDLDLASVEPSVAGPKRPQDRVSLYQTKKSFEDALPSLVKPKKKPVSASAPGEPAQSTNVGYAPAAVPAPEVKHGSVVIAAITSCTNTSNPMVMVAAGLVAKKAVEKGLTTRPWPRRS
jgi:aconitate hydratase